MRGFLVSLINLEKGTLFALFCFRWGGEPFRLGLKREAKQFGGSLHFETYAWCQHGDLDLKQMAVFLLLST